MNFRAFHQAMGNIEKSSGFPVLLVYISESLLEGVTWEVWFRVAVLLGDDVGYLHCKFKYDLAEGVLEIDESDTRSSKKVNQADVSSEILKVLENF